MGGTGRRWEGGTQESRIVCLGNFPVWLLPVELCSPSAPAVVGQPLCHSSSAELQEHLDLFSLDPQAQGGNDFSSMSIGSVDRPLHPLGLSLTLPIHLCRLLKTLSGRTFHILPEP